MKHKPIKPSALKPGNTVAVVAPAAAIEREHLERGVNVLGSMGYRVKVSEGALARSGILAGDDRRRASELQEYFADPEVKAIFSARGGYGCGRLLPLLDFKAIARTPKIFVGFSDATFLLNALVDLAGMISFHGPMVAMDFARGLSPRAGETKGLRRATLSGLPLISAATSVRRGHLENRSSVNLGDTHSNGCAADRSDKTKFIASQSRASNDEVERREVAPTRNEADLSRSSTPSLAHRR